MDYEQWLEKIADIYAVDVKKETIIDQNGKRKI